MLFVWIIPALFTEDLDMNYCKHLSLEDRQAIAIGLDNSFPFKSIARAIHKDCTTVSKEVKKNYSIVRAGCFGHCYNNCVYSFTCPKTHICTECDNRRYINKCRLCIQCNNRCEFYKPFICHTLEKPPYVCNGCKNRKTSCTREKHVYIAAEAQKKYLKTLSEVRRGISLSENEIRSLDELFSPLIRKGQSIHHIYNEHRDEVMISESSIYKLVDMGLFSARNLDLPRKVRFAPRKKKKEFKVEKSCRIGRDYQSFLSFCSFHPDLPITEMDTVEGTRGGKVLLTIHFVKAECMIAFLRERNDSRSVIDAFDLIYERLGHRAFSSIMPVLLGDNGSEFSNPSALENAPDGSGRTRVFYCDPSAPYQKGSAERNHEFIRLFIPKGKSFDPYTQDDIDLMMNNINSYKRPGLGDKSPYEMMRFLYGEDVCLALGLLQIRPDDVVLNASVFNRKKEAGNDL